jgi:hypothetical protein
LIRDELRTRISQEYNGEFKMTKYRVVNSQSGSTLVISILILMIMTIIGVASMSGVLMQERMAGNVNLQSLAFEASSAGINEALDYGMTELATRPCPELSGGNRLPWEGDFSEPQTLNMAQGALHGVTVQYSLRTDCLELPRLINTADGLESVPTFQTYVTSRGEVWQDPENDDDPIAAREIEVRIDHFRRDGLSAMRVEGTAEIVFESGNSNTFIMDGQGGNAISAATEQNADLISEDLAENDRVHNFIGGVGVSIYPPPFNDAESLARFVLRVKSYMKHYQERGLPLPQCDDIQMRFVDDDLHLGNTSTLHGIVYVTGNLTMTGGPTGSGLYIVEGTVQWSGGAQFQGMLINLGGQFELSGGGSGRTMGMLYNANLDLAPLESGGNAGGYLNYDDLNFGAALVDPWFDMFVVNNTVSGNLEVYDPLYHDVILGLDPPYWIPGLVSKLEASASFEPDPDFRGLTYHRLYGGCNHNTWLPLDEGGNHACKGDDDGFGATTVTFSGGGRHRMTYDCGMVDAFRLALEACPLPPPLDAISDPAGVNPEAPECDPEDPMLRKNCPLSSPWPDPQCNVPGAGGRTEAILSWRENVGWRDQLN